MSKKSMETIGIFIVDKPVDPNCTFKPITSSTGQVGPMGSMVFSDVDVTSEKTMKKILRGRRRS